MFADKYILHTRQRRCTLDMKKLKEALESYKHVDDEADPATRDDPLSEAISDLLLDAFEQGYTEGRYSRVDDD